MMRANGTDPGNPPGSMRNGKPAAAALAALAAASLLLASGCVFQEDGKTAGVDEFPNSIYARVNGFLGESRKSEALAPVPGPADSLLVSGGFNVAAGKLAAARKSAAGALDGLAGTAADSGCTAGTLTVTKSVTLIDKTTVNTATVCADLKAFDAIEGNETLIRGKSVSTYGSGRVETADISDADGDGILNPIAGKAAKANIAFSALEKGILEKTTLMVGPGPDNDFDIESDNLVYAASWSRTRGNDTLGSAVYADADGDGVAIDNGKASVVDLDFYEKGPSKDHPAALWSRAQLRLVVRYRVEAKEVRRARFETEDGAGRREIGEVLDRRGGRDFDMRDTVQGHFLSVGTAASDTLDSADVHLAMSLGADFDGKQDDSVYAIDVRSSKKLGEETEAHFSFVSDKPIPSGKDPEAGSLSMSVGYTDGTSITVDGKISAEFLDVILTDRTGKRLHVVWDRQGRGISMETL